MRKPNNFYDKDNYKIAMLGHKRIPSREGGIEIVVEEISTRMAALGHEVVCYNRKGHHVSGKEFDRKSVKIYNGVRLKSVFTVDLKGLAAMTASTAAAIKAAFGRYDIVHFHAEGPCAMLWLPRLLGKRSVATIHGLDHLRGKWGRLASAYIMLGERIAVKFADEMIVLSTETQKYFEQTYGRITRFIPNGVNRPALKEANEIAVKYGLKKDSYILFLGRIVPEKGIGYLIEAFKKVKTDKKLVIAGGASDTTTYMQELKEAAAGDERIVFTGFVQGNLLEELYSNAYLYSLPSDLEGMPLSLLEAMSYGNCCLVSDIAECTEVVKDKAVVFRKGNVFDLTEKLKLLCEDQDLVNQYKKDAADYICTKYNWDEIVQQTIALYSGKKREASGNGKEAYVFGGKI
jgi:glycosyltransferase involved in cell wall biosynthesis